MRACIEYAQPSINEPFLHFDTRPILSVGTVSSTHMDHEGVISPSFPRSHPTHSYHGHSQTRIASRWLSLGLRDWRVLLRIRETAAADGRDVQPRSRSRARSMRTGAASQSGTTLRARRERRSTAGTETARASPTFGIPRTSPS
jgi:hypothetical protein